MSHPWDQQTGETETAYAAFRRYLLLDTFERSIRAACTTPAAIAQWERWSSKHQWVQRVAAWEDHLFQQELRAHERRRLRFVSRTIRADERAFEYALRQIRKLEQRINELMDGPVKTVVTRIKLSNGEVRIERQQSVISELVVLMERWTELHSIAVHGFTAPRAAAVAAVKRPYGSSEWLT